MSVTAKLKYLHIAPRKVRLVADLIRGKKIEEAQAILDFTVKKGAEPFLKLLKSAIANAKHNFPEDKLNFYVSKVLVDEGPKFKRSMPRSRGMASAIQKKTSHITILLDKIEKEIDGKAKKIKKVKKLKDKKIKKVKKLEKEKTIKLEDAFKEKKFFVRQEKFKLDSKGSKPQKEKGVKRIFRRKAF